MPRPTFTQPRRRFHVQHRRNPTENCFNSRPGRNFSPPTKKHATTHIIKPADPRSDYYIRDIDSLEVICLDAAFCIGLPATEARRWHAPSGDLTATILTRYDRHLADDGIVYRFHQEDFCQALSVMPDKKYQHRYGGPGLADMRNVLQKNVSPAHRTEVLADLFMLIVYNVGILGTDAHAKTIPSCSGLQARLKSPRSMILSLPPHCLPVRNALTFQ
ncbi:HipA domain-containing protein [Corynebacterium cystitidis]|uniref:HipA domain-containing protein n=1 Tax=Corynebacterium cystitidis TaxID=35757 RepID=UPI00358DBF48